MTEQKHLYDYAVLPGSVGSIVPRMVGKGTRLLELGTGPGSITKQLHANGCRVTGIEIDPTAVPFAAPYCERIIEADLNSPDWTGSLGEERFDAVVMTDVLEHLYDPWRTLARSVGLLEPEGIVVVSLPHIGHSAILASLLNERFDYQDWGLLDRTHIRFFGLHNIRDLVAAAGLKIVDVDFVIKRPEHTEFSDYWRNLPKAVRQALSFNPHGMVYQVVVKAVRESDAAQEIDLFDAPLPLPLYVSGAPDRNVLLRFLFRNISWANRQRVEHFLHKIGLGT